MLEPHEVGDLSSYTVTEIDPDSYCYSFRNILEDGTESNYFNCLIVRHRDYITISGDCGIPITLEFKGSSVKWGDATNRLYLATTKDDPDTILTSFLRKPHLYRETIDENVASNDRLVFCWLSDYFEPGTQWPETDENDHYNYEEVFEWVQDFDDEDMLESFEKEVTDNAKPTKRFLKEVYVALEVLQQACRKIVEECMS